jgi:cbb3-type cytochrome oxidase subunit 3
MRHSALRADDWCYMGVLVVFILGFMGGLSALHGRDRVKAYAIGVFLLLFIVLIGASLCIAYRPNNKGSLGEEAACAQAPRVARQAELGAFAAGSNARRPGV